MIDGRSRGIIGIWAIIDRSWKIISNRENVRAIGSKS
jgi:hypothetical protein